MKISLITLLLTIFSFSLHAQAYEQLVNKLDKNGKKDGWWIIYLDANWKEVEHDKAVYSRYTNYVNGQNMYLMGPCGKKGWRLMSNNAEVKPVQGYVILLDGEYEWLKEDGKISSTHKFNKGWYADCKEYSKSGKLEQHYDYSTKQGGNENTFLFHQYDKKGTGTHYVWREGNRGWTFYYLSSDKSKNK